ncbi:MAG: hypothetical protein FJ011_23980 [Chloroflexi bacterium]|nr:hypothetical protein [Chloroflexota bacterium]
MDHNRLPHQSELFTVRLWPEELGEGQFEWRGRVQHALSGQTGYFREWSGLIAFLTQALAPAATTTKSETER